MGQTFDDVIKTISRLEAVNDQKRIILANIETKLIIAKDGGIFDITPDLLLFIKMYIDLEYADIILMDKNRNPIKIVDLQAFLEELVERQVEIMNEYYVRYESLKDQKDLFE